MTGHFQYEFYAAGSWLVVTHSLLLLAEQTRGQRKRDCVDRTRDENPSPLAGVGKDVSAARLFGWRGPAQLN
jgi:hypothetical protein